MLGIEFGTKKERINFAKSNGYSYDRFNSDGSFSDPVIERRFRNNQFKNRFGNLPNYSELASLDPRGRDEIYLNGVPVKNNNGNKPVRQNTTQNRNTTPEPRQDMQYLTVPQSPISKFTPQGSSPDLLSRREDEKPVSEYSNADYDAWKQMSDTRQERLDYYESYYRQNNPKREPTALDYTTPLDYYTINDDYEKRVKEFARQKNEEYEHYILQNPSGNAYYDLTGDVNLPRYDNDSILGNPFEYENQMLAIFSPREQARRDYHQRVADEQKAKEEENKQRQDYIDEYYRKYVGRNRQGEYRSALFSQGNIFDDLKYILQGGHNAAAIKYANSKMLSDEQKDSIEEYNSLYNRYLAQSSDFLKAWHTALGGDGAFDPLGSKAREYADEIMNERHLYSSIVPTEMNPYANLSFDDFKKHLEDLSSVYKQYKGDSWMPESEIPYRRLYEENKANLDNGLLELVNRDINRVLENEILDKHQTWFNIPGDDNPLHEGSISSFTKQYLATSVAGLVPYATALVNLPVGFIQAAIDPSDMQLAGGMNWYTRGIDNAMHNDWLGVASNESVSEWAQSVIEDNPIYGSDFLSRFAKNAPTMGYMTGNVAGMFASMFTGKVTKGLINNFGRSINRAANKQIVSQGYLSRQRILNDGAFSAKELFKGNWGENVDNALQSEFDIIQHAKDNKFEIADKYAKEYLENLAYMPSSADRIMAQNEYTEEEFKEAFSSLPKEWQQYFNAISSGQQATPPNSEMTPEDAMQMVYARAIGLHRFNKENPDYDTQVDIMAHNKAVTDLMLTGAATWLIDIGIGSLNTKRLSVAFNKYGVKNKPKRILNTINDVWGGGIDINKFKSATRRIGHTAYELAKLGGGETLQEIIQQAEPAITNQVAEYNIDNFLYNHLYGDGTVILGDTSYRMLYNLNKEKFMVDADLKETIIQTMIGTLLMPSVGTRGKTKPMSRKENEGFIGHALRNLHYYMPVGTAATNQIFNDVEQARSENQFVNYIERFFQDENNKILYRGVAGEMSYALEAYKAMMNGDKASFDNSIFAKRLAETIMYNQLGHTNMTKYRLRAFQNMAEIDSVISDKQQEAIKKWKEEHVEAEQRKLSDEQIIQTIKETGQTMLDLYRAVDEESKSIEAEFGEDISWDRKAALIFGKLAQKDLDKRIRAKKDTIDKTVSAIREKNIDLGTTARSLADVTNPVTHKSNWKELSMSGYDIMSLPAEIMSFILNPKNQSKFSEEQQKINKLTMEALEENNAAPLEDDVRRSIYDIVKDIAKETSDLDIISNQYRETLNTPEWKSKPVEKKRKEINEKIGNNNTDKKFINKVLNADSVSALAKIYDEEVRQNERRGRKKRLTKPIDNLLDEIKDPSARKKIAQFRGVKRAAAAMRSNIELSDLSDDIKQTLLNIVDGLENSANSASDIYDSSKYVIEGLPVEQINEYNAKITNIIQESKNGADNVQTVHTDVPEKQSGENATGNPTDLGSKDVPTAQPANEGKKEAPKEESKKKNSKMSVDMFKYKFNTLVEKFNRENLDYDANTPYEKMSKFQKEFTDEINILKKQIPDSLSIEIDGLGHYVLKEYEINENGDRVEKAKKPIKTGVIFESDEPAVPKSKDVVTKVEEPKKVEVKKQNRLIDNLKDMFKGKIIFVESGAGKTSVCDNETVFDGDYLYVEALSEVMNRDDVDYNNMSEIFESLTSAAKSAVTKEYYKKIIATAQAGNTVLTSSIGFIKSHGDAISYVIALDSAEAANERTKNRDVNAYDDIEKHKRDQAVIAKVEKGAQKHKVLPRLTGNQTVSDVILKDSPYVEEEQPDTSGDQYTNRSDKDQNIEDNNATFARMEITEYHNGEIDFSRRLTDEKHKLIDQILEENGAFDFVSRLNVGIGTEIVYIVTTEEMPDNSNEFVIWEVVKTDKPTTSKDNKFLGYQVINVLDQTKARGKRKALIDRIIKEYTTQNKPASMLYDSEPVYVDKIISGAVPFRRTNPIDSQSNETIESTNLKKNLDHNGKHYGFRIKTKRGVGFMRPVLKQTKSYKGISKTEATRDGFENVQTINKNPHTQEETSVVMLVTPTPVGYQAVHPVYVLKRNEDNVEKYKNAVVNGAIGKMLAKRIEQRISNFKAATAFRDFFKMPNDAIEFVSYDATYSRLDLGIRSDAVEMLVSAIKDKENEDSWFVLKDPNNYKLGLANNGKPMPLQSVLQMYLSEFIESTDASVQININAIKNDPDILDALIEDGMLWCPNAYPGRMLMERSGIYANLDNHTKPENTDEAVQEEEQQPAEEPKSQPEQPTVADVTDKSSVQEKPQEKPKEKVVLEADNANPPKTAKTNKKKGLKALESFLGSVEENEKTPAENPQYAVVGEILASNSDESKMLFSELSKETQHIIKNKNITENQWNDLTEQEKLNVLNCS